jgi:hypothetical protein
VNNFVLGDVNSDFPRLLEDFQSYFNSAYTTTGVKLVEPWTVSDTVAVNKRNFVVVPVSGFNQFKIPDLKSDDVIVLDGYTEAANCLTSDLVAKLSQFSIKKIIVSNGPWDKEIFNYDFDYDIVVYPYWLLSYATYVTSTHTINFYQLDKHAPAPTTHFNCLVGVSRPERDYLVSQLVDKGLVDDNIVSYNGNFTGNGYASWEFAEPWHHLFAGDYDTYKDYNLNNANNADLKFLKTSQWEDYGNFQLPYGSRPWSGREHILPVTIFNDSEFSLVVETSVFNKNFHPTEKTIRNFLLKNPFVVFSSQYFVRYLQELGFRTFGAVIDESYDDIECPKKRCDAILIEVERICNNNLISSNIAYFAEVCEHNYQQMSKLQPYYTKILEKAIGKFFINT